MKNKITAVVVTYNKPELLEQCLSHILTQTTQCNEIVLVDNGGKQETANVIELKQKEGAKITWIKPQGNVGGAGGFSIGIKAAIQNGADYVWIMDDDSLVETQALEHLRIASKKLHAQKVQYGFLASNVRWTDGSAAQMNIPGVIDGWNELADQGLIGLSFASFVSMFVPTSVIREVGLPLSQYFIWGDDVEFGKRISAKHPSFFVSESKVNHAMLENRGVNIFEEFDKKRIHRYFYEYRNSLCTLAEFGNKRQVFMQVAKNLTLSFNLLFKPKGLKKALIIVRGTIAGLFFHPTVETA
ncbi:glycosyltransferase [Levilactobacillus brevis]|uniref:glycosyltransferase n=1 Tax=Lactobacillaceae TaxID=33958 RepID=UPI001C1F1D3B|nr:glycosyltransferase [Levilactobacillus brevis]MBU7540261.1 glycosyltransferase [Levilactobacillus brevis]MBU7566392.1 glycosyltransferase [Levilactobacillus brevis]MCE6039031.1 glycosyltransferase [Levilactobacillus brevis]